MKDDIQDLLERSGTLQSPHSGRSLYLHLRATEALLRSWGCAEPTALAGLFHSIYGTNAYRHASLGTHERQALACVIGADAERLVYLFSACRRPLGLLGAAEAGGFVSRLDGQFLRVAPEDLNRLVEVECANLIEQGSRSPFLAELIEALDDGSVRIAPRAWEAVLRHGAGR